MAEQFVNEYGLPLGDSPDEVAQRNAAYTGFGWLTNRALALPAAVASPDPSLGPIGYLPGTGAVEGLLGLGGKLINDTSTLINAGFGTNLPRAPSVLTTAGEHFEKLRDARGANIETLSGGALAQPDMNTPEGQVADILGSAVGSGVGVMPSAALRFLPAGIRTAASYLLPTFSHTARNLPIMTALGTGAGAGELALEHIAHPEQGTSVADTEAPPAADISSILFGSAQAATPPKKVAPASDPNTILFGPQPQLQAPATPTTQGDPNSILFGSTPPGVTFTQQGSTDVSVWQAGLGVITTVLGALAGRRTHELGNHVNEAERAARYSDPDYAAQTNDYNNDVISRGPGGSLTPPGGVATPAPIPQGGALRKRVVGTAQALGNEVAQAQDYAILSSADPSMAERLSSMIGNTFDHQYQQNRLGYFLQTGHDQRTGLRIPSHIDLLNDHASLDAQRKITFAEGMRSANELNNREKNAIEFMRQNPGASPSLEDIAHDFVGHGSNDLHAAVARLEADPFLADMKRRYKAITDGIIDIGEHPAYTFFAPTEARDMKRWHKDYVPEMDENGKPMHPFGERNRSAATGQVQITTNPMTDLTQHIEQLYPLFERNLLSQELRSHQLNVQRHYPNSAQFMTDIDAPVGLHTSYYPLGGEKGGQMRDPIRSVRTGSGIKYMRVDNPILRQIMSGESIAAARVRLDGMNKARRVFTQGTTGGVSLLTGRAMPLRNMIMTSLQSAVNAPEGRYGGVLHRQVLRAGLPDKRAAAVVRGLDMALTNLPGTVGSYTLGWADRWTNRFADYTHASNTNHPVNKMMRAIAQDHQVDAMSAAAKARWERSQTKRIQDMNVAGQGSPMHLANPGVLTEHNAGPPGSNPMGVRLLSARLAPHAFFDGKWMGAKPYVLNVMHAVSDAVSHMNDAGHDYNMRLNESNPNFSRETMTYETRNLVGNPARMGGNKFVQQTASVLPYTNVSAQGGGRTLRALGERPVESAIALTTGLGTLALISLLTHMRSAAHMDFIQNSLSLQQREANVAIALDDDPTKPTMFPVPQEYRAAYAFMLDIMSKAINYIGARHDPLTFHGVWDGLLDFLGAHITTSNAQAMLHGLVDEFDFINAPPIFGRMDWMGKLQGRSWLESFHASTQAPGARPLPGQGADAWFDTKDGAVFRNLLSNVFGAAAGTLIDIPTNVQRYQNQGHPFWESMGMGIHDWLQTSRESNLSANNILFETPMRLSVVPPSAEVLQPTLHALANLPTIPGATQGLTGRGASALPVPMTTNKPLSTDPLVVQMLMTASSYKKLIDQAMQPINAIKQQMSSVQKQGMDPERRRVFLNDQTRVMTNKYKLVTAYVADMYNILSKFAGKPVTSLGDIDWEKDRSQFAR